MGEFLRVWVPDHVIVDMERRIARGEYSDQEELVHVALAQEMCIPSASNDSQRDQEVED